jgi:hypothetical protein
MQKIEVQKGNAYSRQIVVTKTINDIESAYDLTDKTLLFTLKSLADKSINDDNALIKKTITNHTYADAGLSLLLLTATDTNIPCGRYRCDIRIVEMDSNTETFYIDIVDIVTIRKA